MTTNGNDNGSNGSGKKKWLRAHNSDHITHALELMDGAATSNALTTLARALGVYPETLREWMKSGNKPPLWTVAACDGVLYIKGLKTTPAKDRILYIVTESSDEYIETMKLLADKGRLSYKTLKV